MSLTATELRDKLDEVAALVIGAAYADSTYRPDIVAGMYTILGTAIADWLSESSAAGLASSQNMYALATPGVGAIPDDVLVLDSAPYDFRVLDVCLFVATTSPGGNAQLRDAAGGAGNPLSMLFPTQLVGKYSDDGSATGHATPVVLEGSPVYLRRSKNTFGGEVIALVRRV